MYLKYVGVLDWAHAAIILQATRDPQRSGYCRIECRRSGNWLTCDAPTNKPCLAMARRLDFHLAGWFRQSGTSRGFVLQSRGILLATTEGFTDPFAHSLDVSLLAYYQNSQGFRAIGCVLEC